jgi:hypothetical protein
VLRARIPDAALAAGAAQPAPVPVHARCHVPTGLGSITAGNFGACTNSASGIFFNDAPMTLARYPNVQANGSWAWLTIDSVRHAP